MTAAVLLALLAACEPPGPPSDARQYVQAALEGGPGACEGIQDPALRSECIVFALPPVVAAGGLDEGGRLCEGMQAGAWADECWFQLAELVEAQGDEARALCARAGGFRVRCLGHVVNRLAAPLVQDLPLGEEPSALVAVQDLAESYLGKRAGTAKARQVLRRTVADRIGAGPFDRAACGALDPELCLAAYRDAVSAAAGEGPDGLARVGAVCARGAGLDEVQAAGLPGWTPDGEALATRAWQGLCRRSELPAASRR